MAMLNVYSEGNGYCFPCGRRFWDWLIVFLEGVDIKLDLLLDIAFGILYSFTRRDASRAILSAMSTNDPNSEIERYTLGTGEELAKILKEMQAAAADETVLHVIPRMTLVTALKPH